MKIFETFEYYAQVKICQIPYANFETTSRFLSKFCIPPQFHERKLLQCTFFSSDKKYFAQKEYIEMKIFETFKCLGQNSSNSSCQLWNDKSFPFQILRHSSLSWQVTPLQNFKLILFQLWIKGCHQNPNFESFKCSGENWPYFSCHFPNQKSVEVNVR